MPKDKSGRGAQQVFIQLRPEATEGLELTIRAIEEMNGRVLLSLPPNAIVASLASAGIEKLRGEPNVLSVDAQEIADDRLLTAPSADRAAMLAWNEHLARQQERSKPASSDLSWDAPGRQPPDPPRHIQEMLRRREQEMLDGDE